MRELQRVPQAMDPHLAADTFLPSTASYPSPIHPLRGPLSPSHQAVTSPCPLPGLPSIPHHPPSPL